MKVTKESVIDSIKGMTPYELFALHNRVVKAEYPFTTIWPMYLFKEVHSFLVNDGFIVAGSSSENFNPNAKNRMVYAYTVTGTLPCRGYNKDHHRLD